MNKTLSKLICLLGIGLLSFSLNAQHEIKTVRGIDIKADTDGKGGLEGIRFFAENKQLADFNPKNTIFKVKNFFLKEVINQGKSYFKDESYFFKKISAYGDIKVTGKGIFNSEIGIGIEPQEGLHLSNRNIRVDEGQYQSWGPIELHPDTDNSGDDTISFRNSINEEMAKLQDGVLTLNFNSAIESKGILSICPGKENSQNDIVLFKNGDNEEMAKLQDGTLTLDQIRLNITTFPDYVFNSKYTLMPLNELASFIKKYKHLPKIPSEKEVVEQGMDVGFINTMLVEKIEELTLYTIAQEKQITKQKEHTIAQEKQITKQKEAIKLLAERLTQIEKRYETNK